MGTNYVTSVANSAVNSFYIGENGLAFNINYQNLRNVAAGYKESL